MSTPTHLDSVPNVAQKPNTYGTICAVDWERANKEYEFKKVLLLCIKEYWSF